MEFVTAVSLAWEGIVNNKLRSLLTMLGVIIGVASVISMVAIGAGTNEQVTQRIQSLGSNLLTVQVGGRGAATSLRYDQVMALSELAHVSAVAPAVTGSATVKYGNKSQDTSIEATNADYASARNVTVQSGRFLSALDITFHHKVALVGTEVAQELFGNTNPVGQRLLVNGIEFTVVGLLESKGGSGGMSLDNRVLIPLTSANLVLGGQNIRTIYVQADSPGTVDEVEAAVSDWLLKRFRDEDAFRVFNQADMLATVNEVTKSFSLMLGGIAGISLLVGGIGIMNIMLVSVTERTREIGIRKALGAKRRDILNQFLVESMVLSGSGGVLGLGAGVAFCFALERLFQIPTRLAVLPAAVAFGSAVLVGVFFGLYPARRAADLNPIDALQYE
ncbi:ABC transporter permease [Gelria sp. Kuro-4]|uniref:ABC transporter permease n=1 Tax=Gelria sp. Kuro-4 TaxID=2796927 RepID=UPI001BEDEDEA|nr:ABC transporter permease [Gelria sp. Kuro-4]MDK2927963.1 putative transport system permease protein [Bacillota bacterium]BCV25512.1 permease [Gelria sp. Kuro-4]